MDLGFELFITLSFAWDPPEDVDALFRQGPRRPVTEASIDAIKKRDAARQEVEAMEGNAGPAKIAYASSGFLLHAEDDLRDCDDVDDDEDDGNYYVDVKDTVRLTNYRDSQSPRSPHPLSPQADVSTLLLRIRRSARSFLRRQRVRWSRRLTEVRLLFTDSRYWSALGRHMHSLVQVSRNNGERLVDGEVLSWAYLEGGAIEAGLAIATFFAVLYFHFNVTPTDAKRMQRNLGFKPHSPDHLLQNGDFIVRVIFSVSTGLKNNFYIIFFSLAKLK